MKNKTKALIGLLSIDSITNIIWAVMLGNPLSGKLLIGSLVFSFIAYMVLNELGVFRNGK